MMSQPGEIRGKSCRRAARICLLIRLRTTARLLTFWLMLMPALVGAGLTGSCALSVWVVFLA